MALGHEQNRDRVPLLVSIDHPVEKMLTGPWADAELVSHQLRDMEKGEG